MKKIWLICLILFCLDGSESKIKIGVSLAPYAYFAEKIGKDFVDVVILIPQSRNPKKYDLNPNQAKQIKDLRILITTGAEYEKKWLPRLGASNPSLRILDFAPKDCNEELCYPWLSFTQARQIAKQITHQLRILDLKNSQNYKENLDLFLQELKEMEKKLKPTDSKQVVDYRSVWQTLSQELGLEYTLLKNLKDRKKVNCLITPFDARKIISTQYQIPSSHLLKLNPLRKDWDSLIEEFIEFVNEPQKIKTKTHATKNRNQSKKEENAK